MTSEGKPADINAPTTAFGRLADTISNAAGVVSAVCVVAILVIVCAEVLLRHLNHSLLVTDEIAGYLNAAVIFLGLGYTLKSGGFIRVELIFEALPAPLRLAAKWLFTLISAAAVGMLLYYAIQHVIYAFDQDTRAISILDTPEWIPQSVMVIGLAVLLLQLLAFIVERVRTAP